MSPSVPALSFAPLITSSLGVATQSFLLGLLTALSLVAVLAHRQLRDRSLLLAGQFGLCAAMTWAFWSGLPAALWGPRATPLAHSLTVALVGISLAAWSRVVAGVLDPSILARRLRPYQKALGLVALVVTGVSLLPWPTAHDGAEISMGLLAPLLAGLTLLASRRASEEGYGMANTMTGAAVALLGGSAVVWGMVFQWISPASGHVFLKAFLGLQAVLLGWSLVARLGELRRENVLARKARLAQVEQQSQELEVQVAARSAELTARMLDLAEARQAAERANEGLQKVMVQLEMAASTDRLTGAWNRRRFEEAALPEMALAYRRREPVSVIMFDLDHFKRVNDTYGHGAGDAVLAGTAQAVRTQLRASDALVRWGGEEFLVMAPATRQDGAMGMAEKLRATVAGLSFPDVGRVTISLGVAEFAPGEGLEPWIHRADQALYKAKGGGRNRCVAAEFPASLGEAPPRSLLEVVWEEAYACGHQTIDTQHRKLFHLANALLACATGGQSMEEIALRLETLLAHTAQHFHDEEALLRASSYPNLSKHAAIHASLLATARSLQEEVRSGKLDFGRLVSFLARDLVKGHLLTEDRTYFGFLTIPGA